jgi:hypothetical protein
LNSALLAFEGKYMELSVLTKLRITAVIALGVVVIGILAWPMVRPGDVFGAVTVFGGDIGFGEALILFFLALVIGLIAYFLAWPYGWEIGVLAVPAGLCTWAARSGDMAGLLRMNPLAEQRLVVYDTLRWEGFFWLGIIAAGFAGVLLARAIVSAKPLEIPKQANGRLGLNKYLNIAISLLGSVLIAQFCINLLARDVTLPDARLGRVLGQPAVSQICFAALVSFGAAAFVMKKFLNSSYLWPSAGTAVLSFIAMIVAGKTALVERLVRNWPASFHARAVYAVLPVQLVAFGTLGAIIGFWLAVRYDYWKKYRSVSD